MSIRGSLKQAFGKLDAHAVSKLFETATSIDADEAKVLLDEVERSGCLLIKYPNTAREKKRDALVTVLRTTIDKSEDTAFPARFEKHAQDAARLEEAFREVLALLAESEVGKLAPENQAWAVLDRSAKELQDFDKRLNDTLNAQKSKPGHGGIDVRQVRIKVENGTELEPTSIDHGIIAGVGMTLAMLAHINHWFDDAGVLVLPKKIQSSDADMFKAGMHTVLSGAWRRLDDAWDRARFFHVHTEAVTKQIKSPKGEVRDLEFLSADAPHPIEVYDRVALNRIEQLFFQFQVDVHDSRTEDKVDLSQGPLALPPDKFISQLEECTWLLMTNVIWLPTEDENQQFFGLPLKAWLRGYSYLNHLVRTSSPDASELIVLEEFDLLSRLAQAGLTQSQAKLFLGHVKYQINSKDLYDTPVLQGADGKLYIFGRGLHWPIVCNIILSRLGSLRRSPKSAPLGADDENDESIVQFKSKGPDFQRAMIELFSSHNIAAQTFDYRIDGIKYDCDLAFILDDTLFIFDCKNYSIPLGHTTTLYYFLHRLAEAVEQVTRIAAQLDTNPQIVRQHLGHAAAWKRVVPCVLQALPWSGPAIDGCYMYDASALSRFLEGSTSYRIRTGVHGQTVESKISIPLFKGSTPTANEFVQEMENPVQLRVEMLGWEIKVHPMIFSEKLRFMFPEWDKKPVSPADNLKAMGVSDDKVKQILETVDAEFSAKLRRAKKELDPKAPTKLANKRLGRNAKCSCGSGIKVKFCCGTA